MSLREAKRVLVRPSPGGQGENGERAKKKLNASTGKANISNENKVGDQHPGEKKDRWKEGVARET